MYTKYYNANEQSDQGHEIEENICPVCGNEEIKHGGSVVKLKTITTQWSCPSCMSSGEEVFDIEFKGHRVKVENSRANRDD